MNDNNDAENDGGEEDDDDDDDDSSRDNASDQDNSPQGKKRKTQQNSEPSGSDAPKIKRQRMPQQEDSLQCALNESCNTLGAPEYHKLVLYLCFEYGVIVTQAIVRLHANKALICFGTLFNAIIYLKYRTLVAWNTTPYALFTRMM